MGADDQNPDFETRDRIVAARIESVFERLIGTSLVTVINAALMVLVLEYGHPTEGPWLWLILVLGLALGRIATQLAYRRDRAKLPRVQFWARVAVLGSLLSGVLWGAGAVTLFTANLTDQWLWTLLIGGMCAGAASLHAAHLPTALAFAIPASLPLAAKLASQGTVPGFAGGGMTLAFVLVISFTAFRFSRQFGQTLGLQIALERRTLELDDVNQRLNREIESHRATGETLQRAQKMEALGNLTGGVAHDFNNLLTVIVGNLGLIRDRAGRNEGIARLATSAMTAADRGARLTASLLAFARKQSLHPEPADINGLVLEFGPLLQRAAGDRVKLDLALSEAPCASNVDAAHFQSALLNLVINARDAMPGGGLLLVSTANVDMTEADLIGSDAEPGSFVEISVKDSGVGMSAETAARAFDPFFTTKGGGKGSGLGLSQVYGFARQSGGSALIHSRPGEGAKVSMFLPAWTEAVPEPVRHAPPPSLAVGRPLRILVVDDDADVLVMMREGLARQGWDVMMAPDAEAALGLLDRYGDIGMLVTDIDMPVGMSGVDLALAARRQRPDLPILLISGVPGAAHDAPETFDVLQKPFDLGQLVERVARSAAPVRLDS